MIAALALVFALTQQAPAAQQLRPSAAEQTTQPAQAGQTQADPTSEPHPPLPAPAGPVTPPPVTEQDTALEALTSRVAADLRCPVCQGLSIQDSPSELARQMKAVVRDQLKSGKTPDEVKAYYVSKYGEWVLLTPPAKGFNLAVYLLPLAGLLGGAGLIFVLARRWTARSSALAHGEVQETEEEETIRAGQ